MFNRKKMSDNDPTDKDFFEEDTKHIPINDRRRFTEDGELKPDVDIAPPENQKTGPENELESRLKAETKRREAAEAKLVSVQAKFDEAKTNLERETAEMRARLMKTLEDRAKQGQFDFLTSLLPVLDNLNLAIVASEQDSSLEHLREGVKGTARSFEHALLSVGAEAVESIGADFNPELHEAIDVAEVDQENDGKITAEYSRGYRFGDRLLRPAKVQVGRGRAQAATEQ